MSVNGLHRDRVRVKVRDRVSGRVRVRACCPDSSGSLLTRRKMEFAPPHLSARIINFEILLFEMLQLGPVLY